jgi:oxygen-dependent protoporphyrinogen oxidase
LSDCIELGVDAADRDLNSERVICCLPAYAAQEWMQGLGKQELCYALRDVEYLSMTVISAVFNPADLPGFKPGFGCLIPPSEGFHSLGLLFSHCLFPQRFPQNKLFFRSIMRDDDGSLAAKSETELGAMVAEDAMRLFKSPPGLKSEELAVYRWPKGIPVYSRELVQAWAKLDQLLPQYMPNWRFFGNWTGEISLRGMADAAMTVFGPES